MTFHMLIGGAEEAAEGNKKFDRIDPVTGEVATTVAAASVEDALKAAKAAGAAYPAWSKTGPGERRALFDPPPLKWSAVMFRKTEDQNGYEETQAGRDCHEAAAG